MELYSGPINKLIDELAALPGIGEKSASRLAFHLINMPKGKVERLANTMIEAKQKVCYCQKCFTLTDKELCPVCSSEKRDASTIMVVENSRDLAAYEKTGKYQGVYHVLH
ncbi:MAG: recombination protein RecR, partial [Lachnospiraceae bacterium]|nr:recombination protein RecR [Lachnospiraceae bacterium]